MISKMGERCKVELVVKPGIALVYDAVVIDTANESLAVRVQCTATNQKYWLFRESDRTYKGSLKSPKRKQLNITCIFKY